MSRHAGGVQEDCAILQGGVQAGWRGAGAVPLHTGLPVPEHLLCKGGTVSFLQGCPPSAWLHAGDNEDQGRL